MIPYIGGEEEKSEQEPLKLWGHIEGDKIVPATIAPALTAQCLRVPVSDGHMGCRVLSVFEHTPTKEEILKDWAEFHGSCSVIWELPSAPKQSSCITSPRMTVPSPSWTACWKTAWP